MSESGKQREFSLLSPIRQLVSSAQNRIQSDGKLAFDRDDPAGAKKQAELLEKTDRAEQLLRELDELLQELRIDQPDLILTATPTIPKKHKPNTARKGTKKIEGGPVMYPPQLMDPVLGVLRDLGGGGHLHEIRAGIEKRLGESFSRADRTKMKNHNELRWQYNVRWTLTKLKNLGFVEHGGRIGVWRLTGKR